MLSSTIFFCELNAALTSHAYDGVAGPLQFDENGNVTEEDFVLRTIKDGKFVEVK